MPAVATDPSLATRKAVFRAARSMHPSVPRARRLHVIPSTPPPGGVASGGRLPRSLGSGLQPATTPRRTRLTRLVGCLRAALADQRGSQITDNLGLIVIGIVAIVAIGGLISGLDSTVFKWVTTQLGLGG
jgi:hypothetical protein